MLRMSSSTATTNNFLPRLLLWIFVFSAVVFPNIYQPALSVLWKYLYNSSFYSLSTFETILTVTSYAILEPFYVRKFVYHPELRIDVRDGTGPSNHDTVRNVKYAGLDRASIKKTRPRLPRIKLLSERLGEILLYITPLLLMDLTMIKKFADVPLDDIRVSGGYAPLYDHGSMASSHSSWSGPASNSTSSSTQYDTSIHATFLLPTLHNFTTTSPFQLNRALPPVAPTSRRLALELLTSLIIYDTLFFLLHLSLHKIPFLARLHLPHHTHQEIHAQITNRLSVPERLSLVLLANFSLNIIRSHVFTRTLFVPIFVDLLIQVHSGMDLPYGYEKFLPGGWGLGSREHAKHHRTGGGGYAPFFAWWDGALGLVQGMMKGGKGAREVKRRKVV